MEKRTIFILIILLVVMVCGGLIFIMGLGGGLYFMSQRRAQTADMATAQTAIGFPTEPPTLPLESTTPPSLPPATLETTVEPQPNVDFNGIQFYYPPELAQGVLPELISAAEGDATQSMPGEIHPEYTQFTLQGYLLENTFHDPRIYIYPLAEYRRLDSAVDDVANRLAEIIEKQPEQVDALPFLPLWNAAQIFHAQLSYIEFKNGAGIRFLTQYAQYYAPINNTDLFYTFQGISSNGEWYVAIVMPASHSSLPSSPEESGGEPSDAVSYYRQMSDQLSELDGSTFTPSLLLLDELVSSLRVR